MKKYTLLNDGDSFERKYWDIFIKEKFPSYEQFWLKFVVPLTNRPVNIHFKTDLELLEIGKSKLDIHIAQLNYTVFFHLSRCFDIVEMLKTEEISKQMDLLLEGMSRLVGAQDNAFELLEMLENKKEYKPFSEDDSKKARKKWQNGQKYPLQKIRDYRNSLIHSNVPPKIIDGTKLCLPSIDKINLYLDWRLITQLTSDFEKYKNDFFSILIIFESALNETVVYLESNWKEK